jgi:hypothetical protein
MTSVTESTTFLNDIFWLFQLIKTMFSPNRIFLIAVVVCSLVQADQRLRTNAASTISAKHSFCDCLKVPPQFADRAESKFVHAERYKSLEDATTDATEIFAELKKIAQPGSMEEGLKILACAATLVLDTKAKDGGENINLRPCAPVDHDLKNFVPPSFFSKKGKGSLFMLPAEGGKKDASPSFDVAEFTADLGRHEFCYALDKLPGFAANYAVIVGMVPARNEKSISSFYSVQADVCHTYLMLLRHGVPKKNIVVFSFDDALVAQGSLNKGLYHKSTGEIRTSKEMRSSKSGVGLRCGLATTEKVDATDGAEMVLTIDYTGHMLTNDDATIEEKFADMAANDFIKTHNVISVLRGDSDAMKSECAKKTAKDARCSGRVIHSGPDDHVLIHLNGHGGSNEIVGREMNALFLGDTHYPVSLSHAARDLGIIGAIKHRNELTEKAWGSGSAAKAIKLILSSMMDGIGEVLEQNKMKGLHAKAAVYINACESGGMFDKNSGTGDQLEKANSYVLAAAEKGVPSATFNPSTVRLADGWSTTDNTVYSVASATVFANFWHDVVHRSDPLLISIDEEHRRMNGLAGPFTQFKGGSERTREGFQGVQTLKFTPPAFGSKSVRQEPSGDFTVGPLFRYFYRNTYWPVLQQLKHRACLIGVEGFQDESGDERPIRHFHAMDVFAVEMAEVVLDAFPKAKESITAMEKGNEKKKLKTLWKELYSLATNAKELMKEIIENPKSGEGKKIISTRAKNLKRMKELSESVLDSNQYSRLKTLYRFLTGKAWKTTSGYFRKWLQGDFNSDEFVRLAGKCQDVIRSHGGENDGDDKILPSEICSCLGYDAPNRDNMLDEDGGGEDEEEENAQGKQEITSLKSVASPTSIAITAPSMELKGFEYPSDDDHKWVCVTDSSSSPMSSKRGKMIISVLSAHLEPQPPSASDTASPLAALSRWWSNEPEPGPIKNVEPVHVEVKLHRGVITDADSAAHIGREEEQVTMASTNGGSDPKWDDTAERTVMAFNYINEEHDPATNKDALVLKVIGSSGEFLGEVSMSAAALMGYKPVFNRKTNGLEMTLPLHMAFNGAEGEGKDKKLKEECQIKGNKLSPQMSECASHHEWIPSTEALKWSIENPTKYWLTEQTLAIPKDVEGDKESKPSELLMPDVPCDSTNADCVKLYTDKDKRKYGTITFKVQMFKPDEDEQGVKQ